jgi:hypothetical protein
MFPHTTNNFPNPLFKPTNFIPQWEAKSQIPARSCLLPSNAPNTSIPQPCLYCPSIDASQATIDYTETELANLCSG